MFPLLAVPAIGGALSMATQLAGAIPGKYQKEQKKRLGELDSDLGAGRGLSSAESATMMNTGMQGVRSQTGSMASELARLQAASGGMAGGAAMAQNRDALAGTIGVGAERVGSRVAAANQDALGAKRQEREDIMAAQAQRKQELVNGLAGTAANVAGQYGQMLGGPRNAINMGGRAAAAGVQQDASMARQAALTQQLRTLIAQGMTPEEAARRLGLLPPAAGPRVTTDADLTRMGWARQGA